MRPTASKTGLLLQCQHWARDGVAWDDRGSRASDRGIRFHDAIARYATTRQREAVSDDIAGEYDAATAWIDALAIPAGSPDLLVEASFGWDPLTDAAEFVGHNRDYARDPAWFYGTADLVHVTPYEVEIWDWKTGDGSKAADQLRALALMVARHYGVKRARVASLEVRSSGVQHLCVEELDEWDLAAVADAVREAVRAIPTAQPTPGDHCSAMYCPARMKCPATVATVEQIIPAADIVRHNGWRLTDPVTSGDFAVWLLSAIRTIESWTRAKRDEVSELVPAGGWPLADGGVLRDTKRTVQRFDQGRAIATLKQLGASAAQIDALYTTSLCSGGLRVVKK